MEWEIYVNGLGATLRRKQGNAVAMAATIPAPSGWRFYGTSLPLQSKKKGAKNRVEKTSYGGGRKLPRWWASAKMGKRLYASSHKAKLPRWWKLRRTVVETKTHGGGN